MKKQNTGFKDRSLQHAMTYSTRYQIPGMAIRQQEVHYMKKYLRWKKTRKKEMTAKQLEVKFEIIMIK